MLYERIARYVSQNLWAITSEKMADLLSVLAYRAAGHEFTPEEIQGRIGAVSRDGATQGGGVAVIPIRGVIAHRMGGMDESSGGMSTERIGAMLDQVAADPNIRTIAYDVDSPGGTVPGVQELAAKMFALRGTGKRQIAQVNSMACSAAYWLASQCDEIVCLPSGTAGSIGVFCAHEDMSAALEKEGIRVTLISAGKHKVAGNPFEPLSDDERAVVQARVDTAYAQFVKDVARGRGTTPAAVRSGYGEGRALDAKDAKASGLVDRIGTMEETMDRLLSRGRASVGARADAVAEELLATEETCDPKSSAALDAQQAQIVANEGDLTRRARVL